MAKKEEKSINPSFKDKKVNEVQISTMDFEKNHDILFETITKHLQNTACENCQWTIHITNDNEIGRLTFEKKDCLLKIFITKELVNGTIEKLEESFDVSIKKTINDSTFNWIIAIYCEQPIIFE